MRSYVNPSGPEFSQIFNPTARKVSVKTLAEEVQLLESQLKREREEAVNNENFEAAEKLQKLEIPLQELEGEVMLLGLTPDDVTDDRYKLDDRKRRIAQELNLLTSGKRIERLRNEYQAAKNEVAAIVNESGNDQEFRQLNEVKAQEHIFLNSTNPQRIEAAIDQMYNISAQILRRTPDFLIGWFQNLVSKREMLNDQLQVNTLIEQGKKLITEEDFERLLAVNGRLHSLLPEKEKKSREMKQFTGIS